MTTSTTSTTPIPSTSTTSTTTVSPVTTTVSPTTTPIPVNACGCDNLKDELWVDIYEDNFFKNLSQLFTDFINNQGEQNVIVQHLYSHGSFDREDGEDEELKFDNFVPHNRYFNQIPFIGEEIINGNFRFKGKVTRYKFRNKDRESCLYSGYNRFILAGRDNNGVAFIKAILDITIGLVKPDNGNKWQTNYAGIFLDKVLAPEVPITFKGSQEFYYKPDPQDCPQGLYNKNENGNNYAGNDKEYLYILEEPKPRPRPLPIPPEKKPLIPTEKKVLARTIIDTRNLDYPAKPRSLSRNGVEIVSLDKDFIGVSYSPKFTLTNQLIDVDVLGSKLKIDAAYNGEEFLLKGPRTSRSNSSVSFIFLSGYNDALVGYPTSNVVDSERLRLRNLGYI